MRLSVIVSPTAGYAYDELREIALAVEAAGTGSLWIADHFFGGTGDPEKNCLEAWTLIAALARDTTSLRLGTMVTCAGYRSPALLAKTVASVDHLSGGRIDFGVGAGWKENEYTAYGYDFPPAGVRIEQLIDTLEICRRMWTEPVATYAGKHFRVTDAVCAPKPVQRPSPPIWIGGRRPRMLRVAARYADGLNLVHGDGVGRPRAPSPADWEVALAQLAQACQRIGRDVREIALSHYTEVYFDDVPSDGPRRAGSIEGNDETVAEAIRGYAAVGVGELCLAFPKGREVELVGRVRERVAPLLL